MPGLPRSPEFAKKYRVVAFDNRGSGRTDAPDMPYSIRMMAEDTAGLMDALRIEKAHVLGVSMGGYIAEELAMTYPSRVASLVLATTSVGPYLVKISILQAWAREALRDMPPLTFFQIMLPFMFNDRSFETPGVLEMAVGTIAGHSSTPPHILARQMTACVEHDARDRIGRISVPTLVLAGKEDPFVPFSSPKSWRPASQRHGSRSWTAAATASTEQPRRSSTGRCWSSWGRSRRPLRRSRSVSRVRQHGQCGEGSQHLPDEHRPAQDGKREQSRLLRHHNLHHARGHRGHVAVLPQPPLDMKGLQRPRPDWRPSYGFVAGNSTFGCWCSRTRQIDQ